MEFVEASHPNTPETSTTVTSPSPTVSSPALEVALAAFICFLPSIAAGYVYDDLTLIRDNAYAHGLTQLPRAFTTEFWAVGAAARGSLPYYRPLVTATYILNWVAFGGKAWAFHFFNTVIHAAATYFVLRIVQRWTGRTAIAVAAAAVFALHPSRTESVEWIAGRTDVLMTLFLLIAVEAQHEHARATAPLRRGSALAALIACALAALLCKESAVVLPLLLLVEVLVATEPTIRRRAIATFTVGATLAVAYLLTREWFLPLGVHHPFDFTPRYGFYTLFAYAERVVFPWPQTFFHRPLVSEGGSYVLESPLVFIGGVLFVAYGAHVVATYRSDRAAAVLLASAPVSLGPLLNFTHTGLSVTTSDHFLYLPLFLLLGGFCRRYRQRLSVLAQLGWARVAFACLLSVYLVVDVSRVFDYRDQETLFQHEIALNPRNPLALRALSEVSAGEGKIQEAFEYLRRGSLPDSTRYALLLPDYRLYDNYLRMLGLMAAMTADGNVRDLTLLHRELDALLDGRLDTVRGHIGELELGRPVSLALHRYALEYGTRDILAAEAGFLAVRLGDDGDGRTLLGSIRTRHVQDLPSVQNVALAYARMGDFDDARRWLDMLVRLLPDRFTASALLPERRSFNAAEELFRRARLAPDIERRRLVAQAYLELGAYLRALRVARVAHESNPTDPVVGSLYLHLLVVAGLEHEALKVATHALGPERGAALVERIRSEMSDRLKSLRKPAEPSDWYTSEVTPG